jgi:hypothetical protein
MYAAGFKQVRLWVPRDFDAAAAKLKRQAFTLKLDQITAGMSKTAAQKLYARLLKTARELCEKKS